MSKKALLAKVSRPRLFGVVPRERLFALLDDNLGRPLIWISSPPGAGKTALTASYIEARELPALWYQIDGGDADPATLFHHLAQAVEDFSAADSAALPRFVPEHLADLQGFARIFFRALFARMPERFIWVLDNYQEAPEDAPLHDILSHAVAEVPRDCSIIAISRVGPPRDFVQFAARGAMLEMKWEQLQLTFEEVRAVAARRKVADDWLLKALHQQSQGWAAGVTLMLERLGHFEGALQELPTDTRESVFNYFASLIFDQTSERNRRILLSISFLPRVTSSYARELSGDDEAGVLLEEFYRRRLFTDRRPGAEPAYQFHSLFSHFLRSKAKELLSRAEFDDLLRRSAHSLERQLDIDAAMELWSDASYWDEAIRIVKNEAHTLLNSGRRQTLLRWIQEIPEQKRRNQPALTYWLGCAELQIVPELGIKTLQLALDQYRRCDELQGRIECLAALIDGAFVGFHALDEMNKWLDELLFEIELSPAFSSENIELRVWGVLCMALFHIRPWHSLTISAYRRVEELLPSCDDPSIALAAAMHALVVSGLCGDFERGDRIASITEKLALQDIASPSEAAWAIAQIGWLRFAEAQYENALTSLQNGQRIAENNNLRHVLRQILLWRYTIEWRTVGWSVAEITYTQALTLPRSSQPMTEAQLHLFKARALGSRGDKQEAARLAMLSQNATLRIGSRLEDVIFGLSNTDVLLHAEQLEEVHRILVRLAALIARTPVYQCYRAALIFMQARYAQVVGNRGAAIDKLRESLCLARADSGKYYLRFADWSMPPLFALALEEGIEVNLVQDVIRMFRLKPPAGAPDRWPWPARIFTLGRFEVQIDGEKLEFPRKLPRKTLLLLKAIIAFGGRDVPEQALCDALWGDEEGDAARNALSITILRLRKLFGPNESVIHQGGKISLNPEICWVDAWAFEGRIADTAISSQKVLSLYTGTFLAEEDGASWAVSARERLRGKFIDALSRRGADLETEGDLPAAIQCYLRGIDADPIVESFYQGLMRCYEKMDKRSEAFSTYRRLKRTLSVLLGVPPAETTQNLFQQMLQHQSETGVLDDAVAEIPPIVQANRGVVVKLRTPRAR